MDFPMLLFFFLPPKEFFYWKCWRTSFVFLLHTFRNDKIAFPCKVCCVKNMNAKAGMVVRELFWYVCVCVCMGAVYVDFVGLCCFLSVLICFEVFSVCLSFCLFVGIYCFREMPKDKWNHNKSVYTNNSSTNNDCKSTSSGNSKFSIIWMKLQFSKGILQNGMKFWLRVRYLLKNCWNVFYFFFR